MNTYYVEFDGINECEVAYYDDVSWHELIGFVNSALGDMGGGHADIYDAEGDFIEAVEVQ